MVKTGFLKSRLFLYSKVYLYLQFFQHWNPNISYRFDAFQSPDSFSELQDWFPETEVMEKRNHLVNIITALTQEAKTNSDIPATELPVPQNISLSPKLQPPMDTQIEEPARFTTQIDRQTFLQQVIL